MAKTTTYSQLLELHTKKNIQLTEKQIKTLTEDIWDIVILKYEKKGD